LKKILKVSIYGVIIFVTSLILLFFLLTNSSAHIQQAHFIDSKTALKTKQVLSRLKHSFKSANKPSYITMSQAELNSISALAHRAAPQLVSKLDLNKQSLHIKASINFTLLNISRYLNINTQILANNKALVLGDFSVGSISLPGSGLLNLTKWALNQFVEADFGNKVIGMIKQILINSKTLAIRYQIPDNFNQFDAGSKSKLLSLRDKIALFGDVDDIRFYHHSLVKFAEKVQTSDRLVTYLGFIFQLAKKRSDTQMPAGTSREFAHVENKKALTALSLYFGADEFEVMVGDIQSFTVKQKQRRRYLQANTKLLGRVDLQKHFVYSIALQLFASLNASDAMGEMKEFLDSNKGGSGFSFADLQADRAGARLAMLSTMSEQSALKTQQLVNIDMLENEIMPNIINLPEGVNQKIFEQKYQGVNAVEYKEMLTLIDNRLSKLAIYQ